MGYDVPEGSCRSSSCATGEWLANTMNLKTSPHIDRSEASRVSRPSKSDGNWNGMQGPAAYSRGSLFYVKPYVFPMN